MPRHALLNNIDHRDLRIDVRRGEALGDAVMLAPIFPAEFRAIQPHYPIVFQRLQDGSFQPVALFGFQPGQNLFLEGDDWQAPYLPLSVERQPFLIGASGGELLIHVDLDHPRVGGHSGEAVFREHGGTSDYLERINSVLLALHDGLAANPVLSAALLAHGLLESFVLDISLNDGTPCRLAGFHTIHEERLKALDAGALASLHAAGHLEAIYMAIASLSNFRDLIARLNGRHAACR